MKSLERISAIVTHRKPHLDEILAILLLQEFGAKLYPGIADAKLLYWGHGPETFEGFLSKNKCRREDVLSVGVGGGPFDEHQSGSEGKRTKGECAATLVAKVLGIEHDAALQKVLKYVRREDERGEEYPFGLATIVKDLHQCYDENPDEVVQTVLTILRAKISRNVMFANISPEEFAKVSKMEKINGPHGGQLTMTTVTSDDRMMVSYAKSVSGGSAHIVLNQTSQGHVRIFTAKRAALNLAEVHRVILIAEEGERRKRGEPEAASRWYYHEEAQSLLNGSLTAPEVLPTLLSLETLQGILRTILDQKKFAKPCTPGPCNSTPEKVCPWASWGLSRCVARQGAASQKELVQLA